MPAGQGLVQSKGTSSVAFDPSQVDLETGIQRFRFDPRDPGQQSLQLLAQGGINGHPVDWLLLADPGLDEGLVAVRRDREHRAPPAWSNRDGPLREETFHSPFSGRTWQPDTTLVRRLLDHTPYVLVVPIDETAHYAFDMRSVDEPRRLSRLVREAGGRALPASGTPWTSHGQLDAIVCQVPFSGDRVARSTRKRFRLAVPGVSGDATVEGAAARVLRAHGYEVESPRLLVALYRMLIGEPIAHWWRDPRSIEGRGAARLQPPGEHALAALHRGMHAVHAVAAGQAPTIIGTVARSVVAAGRRPDSYLRYTRRLSHFAKSFGAAPLAAILEGLLRGHRPSSADLVAMHPGTGQTFLVEVKSTGDRLRDTQMAAALWLQRDGRCGYRLMKMEHPKT